MNYDLFRTINNWSGHRLLDDVMKVFAKDLLFLVFVAFALLCGERMRERDLRPVGFAFAGVVLTFLFGQIAAKLHSEPRPFQTHQVHQLIAHDPGQSFPSDHAIAAFGVALAVLMFLSRAWGGVLVLAAVAIGFSRVYAGVHYPGDIAGAFVVAVLGVGVVASVAWLRPPAPGAPRPAAAPPAARPPGR
jgi:undecaprenyl-diphosphatase